MAPAPIRIQSPATYAATLERRGKVRAAFAGRRAEIRRQVEALAGSLDGRALIADELLDEVTALVEWPVAIAGRFDARYLSLPREVLISTLQDHQRYFALERADGALMPGFITVSNIDSPAPEVVRAGNERVVRPRLADAEFFWEQDRRQPLQGRLAGLANVTFQAQLVAPAAPSDSASRPSRDRSPQASAPKSRQRLVPRRWPNATCRRPGSGNSPTCRVSWAAITRWRGGLSAPQSREAIGEQYLPRGARDMRWPASDLGRYASACGQNRYAGRHFRHRPEAYRHARSIRPAARRYRRAAHRARTPARTGSARAAAGSRAAAAAAGHYLAIGSAHHRDPRLCARMATRAVSGARGSRRQGFPQHQHRDVRCRAR